MKLISEATVFFPHLLLLIAAFGAVISWFRPFTVRLPHGVPLLAILAAIFGILIFGTWSGFASKADVNYFGIGGRIPHSDAGAYFLGSFEIGYAGQWGTVSSYRPVAAAFRNLITAAAGLDYSRSIIVQALLLAAALSFAAHSVSRWLGPWAALAFVAFLLIMIRPFLGTAMTESLALVFALCGVAFIADALRRNCVQSALAALLCVSVAQATRPGAILLLLTMAIWVFLINFDRQIWIRRLALIGLVALAPQVLGELLRALYADSNVSSSGNFAYIACAVARGTSWLECHGYLIAQGLTGSDAGTFDRALYDLAWRSFTADPTAARNTLWANLSGYVYGTPSFMLESYGGRVFSAPGWLTNAVLFLCAMGAAVHLRRSPRDILFWLFAVCGIVGSAAVVLGTDGWRTMYASHPLVALFLVMGWRSGWPDERPATNWRSVLVVAPLCATALVIAPAILHLALRHPPTAEFDARAITGFVVIPDGTRRLSVPSMHASEFSRMIATTALEQDYGPFVQPIIQAAPIAMFWTAQIGHTHQSSFVYFGPPDLLTNKTARSWRFTFQEPPPWQKKGGPMRVIAEAKPAS